MKKVVYVTGCLGFIGSYVTRTCLKKGWYVKGVDKMTYASNKHLLDEFKNYDNFSFVHCDINDLKFLYDCDYVINTAAETHVGNSIANSDDFVHSNINGVHNLLELIRNHRGKIPRNQCFYILVQMKSMGILNPGHTQKQIYSIRAIHILLPKQLLIN